MTSNAKLRLYSMISEILSLRQSMNWSVDMTSSGIRALGRPVYVRPDGWKDSISVTVILSTTHASVTAQLNRYKGFESSYKHETGLQTHGGTSIGVVSGQRYIDAPKMESELEWAEILSGALDECQDRMENVLWGKVVTNG